MFSLSKLSMSIHSLIRLVFSLYFVLAGSFSAHTPTLFTMPSPLVPHWTWRREQELPAAPDNTRVRSTCLHQVQSAIQSNTLSSVETTRTCARLPFSTSSFGQGTAHKHGRSKVPPHSTSALEVGQAAASRMVSTLFCTCNGVL